ncbi:hypothetical protein MRX96_007973 [Rhipicephalus microplus]
MDLRPVYLRDEISVAFEYSTTRGVILFPDWAAGFQRTLPSTGAPDLERSADEGVVNTEASASAALQYASPQSPVESSYGPTCNEDALPTQTERSAATSRQAECIEDSHGTQRDTSVPVELSSLGLGTAAENMARDSSDNVATIEEATSAALDAIKWTSETHSLSSPGASAPLEPASPESIPVESIDTGTSSEAVLPTKFQRRAAASKKSRCNKVSQGTHCDFSMLVEASSPGEGTAAEVIVCEPSGNVSTLKEATSAEVDAMKSTGDTHTLSAPGDYRDE